MKPTQEFNTEGIHPDVLKLNFDKINWWLTESREAIFTKQECLRAEREYRRYLTLKKLYPEEELVIDSWLDHYLHAHILDTRAYQEDCQTLFGKLIHHSPYVGFGGEEEILEQQQTFNRTRALYFRHFKHPSPGKEGSTANTYNQPSFCVTCSAV